MKLWLILFALPNYGYSLALRGSESHNETILSPGMFVEKGPSSHVSRSNQLSDTTPATAATIEELDALFVANGVCRNNDAYAYTDEPGISVTCHSIEFFSDERLRLDLCRHAAVHHNCPKACGVCCEDDPKYSVYIRSEIRNCKWISEDELRIFLLCDTYNDDGRMVMDGCPVTCDSCKAYVSLNPTIGPSFTALPSLVPSPSPTLLPTISAAPSSLPSVSSEPTSSPSIDPSDLPSDSPSPSVQPSSTPSSSPSVDPSVLPSGSPSVKPSSKPSFSPSANPSQLPSGSPSVKPSNNPSSSPSVNPSDLPSASPSVKPSSTPSSSPSANPSELPSGSPSVKPSSKPSFSPSANPSESPSGSPSVKASNNPSYSPSVNPSDLPSASPSVKPSSNPSSSPSVDPSELPSASPSVKPSSKPSFSPSANPSESPSGSPTLSTSPTSKPSSNPTANPTQPPTQSIKPSPTPTEKPTSAPSETPPNLIMIITDEHNYRTLGCYRRYLRSIAQNGQTGEDTPWGAFNYVYTPNIDILASEGALFTNFYTVAPLCSPSRASFMSGLYPPFTGADKNNAVMDESITTFANVLKEQGNYQTSYLGKWHLSGEGKPGWNDPGRSFGFDNTRFKYNRGHWKYFEAEEDSWKVHEYEIDGEANFVGSLDKHYASDFLFDQGISDIKKALDKDQPFAMVLSIPDPHGPNNVRPPFRNRYNYDFEYPPSGISAIRKDPAPPKWNNIDHEEIDVNDAEQYISDYEKSDEWQEYMRQYFGMVACIDENVGKLLSFLTTRGIDDNTIIVFTSDHGDLLGEHGKMNKGRPFETSAGVPFIVRYPKAITAGKVIETAYSSVDFTPTLLKLMGIEDPGVPFHGVDATPELLSKDLMSSQDRIVFTMDSGDNAAWVAAVTNGFKLVVSRNDVPWFFDLIRDPREVFNYFEDPQYATTIQRLQDALLHAMKEYKFPVAEGNTDTFFWDMPACKDSRDPVILNSGRKIFCSDLGVTQNIERCFGQSQIRTSCPVACSTCCQDSIGKLWFSGELKSCSELSGQCGNWKVDDFCPSTCNTRTC